MDISQNIDDFSQREIDRLKELHPQENDSNGVQPLAKVDVYQAFSDAQLNESRKVRPHGSSALVKAATQAVINGEGGYEGVAKAYKMAERDCDYLRGQGEEKRAALVMQQYMTDKFLPAVEVVVNTTSPDELLNCKPALDAFDKFAPVVGAGKGFTAAYVKQAYGDLLGQEAGQSDPTVVDAVRRMKANVDAGNIRSAYGLAKKIKRQIDNGEHIADDWDYAFIGRLANA